MPNRSWRRNAYAGRIRITYTLGRFVSVDDRQCKREVAPVTSTSCSRIKILASKHANETCAHAYELHDEAVVRRCLLGWMATDSGVRLPEKRYNTHALGMKGTARFVKELQSKYGLSSDQLKQLQRANDESKSAAHRTELVSGLVETWSAGPVPSGENGHQGLFYESSHVATRRAAYIAPPG